MSSPSPRTPALLCPVVEVGVVPLCSSDQGCWSSQGYSEPLSVPCELQKPLGLPCPLVNGCLFVSLIPPGDICPALFSGCWGQEGCRAAAHLSLAPGRPGRYPQDWPRCSLPHIVSPQEVLFSLPCFLLRLSTQGQRVGAHRPDLAGCLL